MRTLLKIAFVPGILAATLMLASCQSEPVAPQSDKTATAVSDSLRSMDDQPPKSGNGGGGK